MKRTSRKLALRADAIRNLGTLDLRDAVGGAGFKESTPGGVCNPDPPPRVFSDAKWCTIYCLTHEPDQCN